MKNIIRADIYRIFRRKGLYITLAIFLALIILHVVVGIVMYSGILFGDFDMPDAQEMEEAGITIMTSDESAVQAFGHRAPYSAMNSPGVVFYILLPLLVFISTTDFSSGAVKNTLAGGMTRLKYYSSKLLLSCLTCALLFLAYVLLYTVIATMVSGFGRTLDWDYISQVLRVFLMQLLLFLAITCVGHFFIFITRSAAVIGVYLAFILAPSLILMLLTFIDSWFENLIIFDLTVSLVKVVDFNALSSGEIQELILIGFGYIIAASIGGYFIFKRAEIK